MPEVRERTVVADLQVSIGRVAADGDAFRFVPVFWDY